MLLPGGIAKHAGTALKGTSVGRMLTGISKANRRAVETVVGQAKHLLPKSLGKAALPRAMVRARQVAGTSVDAPNNARHGRSAGVTGRGARMVSMATHFKAAPVSANTPVEDHAVVEFTITGEELWARMERAVEKVNVRLRNTVKVLEDAKVPYAVVGSHAVRAWVAQVDEAAVRTTQDVDVLVRPSDLPDLIAAMTAAGFYHRNTAGLDTFVEHPDASARDAVHVLLVGNVERSGEPNPDIEPAARANDFQTVELETLVRMKLNAFRDKDRVHLRDMISLGMIDATWLHRYPEQLRLKLAALLNDPDG